jgi:peptidoglycan/xylan/chitin deacetylase (PgdA/CDA1 family)
MRIYSDFRKLLSNRNKGRLTRFLVNSGLKPQVNKQVVSPFKTGIVVLSADFEMAWAFRYSKTKASQAMNKGIEERRNVPVLLAMFNKNQLPVTWATVGHLFLNECKRNKEEKAHADMPRPSFFENNNWLFDSGDWYQHDPCTRYENSPAWYAPDLIDQIIQSEVKHEIGCHSFSHVDFNYMHCQKELADAELDACIKLAGEKGIRLKSIVFPGGTAGNFKSLVDRGFLCYRKPLKNHIDMPYIDPYGLVAIPSSLNLDKDPYGWTKAFHLKMIRKYMEKIIKSKLVCHFWFHPSMHGWYLENIMPEITGMMGEYNASGKIRVLTMGQLAEEVIKK